MNTNGTKFVKMFLLKRVPLVAAAITTVYGDTIPSVLSMYSSVRSIVEPCGAVMVTRPVVTVEEKCHDPNGVSIDGFNFKYAGISIEADVSEYFSGTELNELFDPSVVDGCNVHSTLVPCVWTGLKSLRHLIRTALIKQIPRTDVETTIN